MDVQSGHKISWWHALRMVSASGVHFMGYGHVLKLLIGVPRLHLVHFMVDGNFLRLVSLDYIW